MSHYIDTVVRRQSHKLCHYYKTGRLYRSDLEYQYEYDKPIRIRIHAIIIIHVHYNSQRSTSFIIRSVQLVLQHLCIKECNKKR